MCDICDDYGFHFLEHVDKPLIQLMGVGKQSRYSKAYYWNNSKRPHCYLFQYTLSGSGTLKTREDTYILEKEDAFFLQMPNDDIYFFDEDNNTAPWEFIYIIFRGDSIEPYYKYIVNHFGKVMRFSEYHPTIRKLFEVYMKAGNGQLKTAFAADSEVFSFLCLLCANQENEKHQKLQLVEGAKEYIEDNFEKNLSLLSVAEYLGVSQSHLSREFSKHTGEQPVKYLTKVRLEKAIDMLCTTDMNLDSISRACGFGDGNYFSKVFRKYMNVSPSEFREQVKIQGYKNIQI